MNGEQTLTQVVVAFVMSYVLEWLKRASWFPILTERASRAVKVAFSALVAAGSAVAISVAYDAAGGVLTVSGLTWAHLWDGLVAFLVSFLTQHAVFEGLLKKGGLSSSAKKAASWLLVAALALTVAGCGLKSSAIEVRANVILSLDGVKTAMLGLQKGEHAVYASGAAPALTQEKHRAFNAKMVEIWPLLDDAAVAVQAWKPGEPVPAQIATCITRISTLLENAAAVVGVAVPDQVAAVWAQVTKFLALIGGVQ